MLELWREMGAIRRRMYAKQLEYEQQQKAKEETGKGLIQIPERGD